MKQHTADIIDEATRQEQIMDHQLFCAEQARILYGDGGDEIWQRSLPGWAEPHHLSVYEQYETFHLWDGESAYQSIRCQDCEVGWIGEETKCWSCGKDIPLEKVVPWLLRLRERSHQLEDGTWTFEEETPLMDWERELLSGANPTAEEFGLADREYELLGNVEHRMANISFRVDNEEFNQRINDAWTRINDLFSRGLVESTRRAQEAMQMFQYALRDAMVDTEYIYGTLDQSEVGRRLRGIQSRTARTLPRDIPVFVEESGDLNWQYYFDAEGSRVPIPNRTTPEVFRLSTADEPAVVAWGNAVPIYRESTLHRQVRQMLRNADDWGPTLLARYPLPRVGLEFQPAERPLWEVPVNQRRRQ